MLGNSEVREDPERAVHAKDRSGKARRAGMQGRSKNGGRGLWRKIDGINFFAVPSAGQCRLSSRRSEVAYPVHDPIRGDQVALLIMNENGERGHNGLATFPPAHRE